MNSVILHQNQKWYNFINTIKNKKDNICSCCKKKKELMLLDFNHYKIEKDPWEQEEKSAFLVCNSCFKNNENIEEPDIGWYLLDIRDLGGLSGICKKKSCKQKILLAVYFLSRFSFVCFGTIYPMVRPPKINENHKTRTIPSR